MASLRATPVPPPSGAPAAPPTVLPDGAALDRVFHELRRPLAVARAHAELLADGVHGPLAERQAGGLEHVLGACLRLGRDLDRLQELLSGDPGPTTFPEEPLDLLQVLADAAGRVGAVLRRPSTCPCVPLPREPLEGLLEELLENARTHGAPPVSLEVELGARELVLLVRDSGPGMTRAELERARAPFERGAPLARGLGIGLPLALLRARRIGARLELLPGPGAQARIVLPLA